MNDELKQTNKQWIEKQEELHKNTSSFHWGLTIFAIIVLVLLIFLFVTNYMA